MIHFYTLYSYASLYSIIFAKIWQKTLLKGYQYFYMYNGSNDS